nr:hypothetical protein [Mesoplasma photuris]
MMSIILIILLVVVIVFVIVTTITGRKASKKEKAKRYKEVRDRIKHHILKTENKKNLRIEFEKVYSRKGAEYKYRDVFDVIVEIIDPKTNQILEVRAYEIEGITTKVDKKNYKTDWIVNGIIDLDDAKKRISIAEKEIKLTKEEKSLLKKQERQTEKDLAEKEKAEMKLAKQASKSTSKVEKAKEADKIAKQNTEKFVPVRKKN